VRRSRTLVACALTLVAATAPAPAGAARREHTVHGTVRKLCDPVSARKWPGGTSAGRVAAGRDMRRYHYEDPWMLGVTTRRPFVRGYVLARAFCPPSAAGRRAAAVARRLAANPPRGRPGVPLARPLLRRICAPVVYLRDSPLNRAIALLYVGDAFRATRRARNPWLGGLAQGHARRHGWVPRSAVCGGLDHRASGHESAPGPSGSTVLAPPRTLRCGARVSGRRLLQVGVRGAREVAVELRDSAGAVVSSARFVHGQRGRWSYAAAGPYHCGRSFAVVYMTPGAQVSFPVSVTRRSVSLAAADALRGFAAAVVGSRGEARGLPDAATPDLTAAGPRHAATTAGLTAAPRGTGASGGLAATAPSAGDPARRSVASCASRPQRKFAHGGNGPVDHRFHARPAISADGRRVAFDLPAAGLVAGDRNGARDVFVRDTVRGRTRLVSVARGGGVGNATSRAAAISADGRVVAFESSASDLVAGDDDGVRDVFVRNVRAGTTRLVAPGRSPALSGDGHLVAYETAGGVDVADLRTGAIRRLAAGGYRPSLSADGRFAAYESRTGSSRDANRNWDVFRSELATGTTVLLSAASDGRSRRGQSLAAVLSADGMKAAFQSDAPLVAGDRTGLRDVYLRDVKARRTILVSANRCGGPANGYNRYPSISADGRRVAFDSHATDLVAGAPRGRGQVYLRDVGARRTRLLSVTPAGRASARTSFSPALAARAATAAFPSFAYDLGPSDANGRVDIYLRAVARGRTRLLSRP
jgi:Tol biopolymer transport system component